MKVELGKDKFLKLSTFLVILCLIINIISYKYLPNKVGIQKGDNGHFNSFVPRIGYVFMDPIFLALITAVNVLSFERYRKSIIFLASILIFVLNIWTIFENIKM